MLEKERKNGRNNHPVRAMLNLIYAIKIYEHRGIESLRRQLKRNSKLRHYVDLMKENINS